MNRRQLTGVCVCFWDVRCYTEYGSSINYSIDVRLLSAGMASVDCSNRWVAATVHKYRMRSVQLFHHYWYLVIKSTFERVDAISYVDTSSHVVQEVIATAKCFIANTSVHNVWILHIQYQWRLALCSLIVFYHFQLIFSKKTLSDINSAYIQSLDVEVAAPVDEWLTNSREDWVAMGQSHSRTIPCKGLAVTSELEEVKATAASMPTIVACAR